MKECNTIEVSDELLESLIRKHYSIKDEKYVSLWIRINCEPYPPGVTKYTVMANVYKG